MPGTSRRTWPTLFKRPAGGRPVLRRTRQHDLSAVQAPAALPHETIVIDRRLAILAGLNGPGGREYTLTTAPTLVGGVCALFDAAWDAATDLKAFLRGEQPQLDTVSRTVLRALGSGATDEKAARELGMSPAH
ncbi:hypothetical protein AB0E25_11265 [Streptomyces bobili]|uniref:hypothetical protein n=1 Tax=Streptomyces bobili TaxID=67280 RepID=UPI003403DAD9